MATSITNTSVTTDNLTTDGLTVDTNTIHVDSANKRVGIGTTTPDNGLHVEHPTGGAEMKVDAAAGYQATYLLAEG